MRIIYIADDGTQFDNEVDCEDYEWKLDHPHLKDVRIYDKNGIEFTDVFSEDAYSHSAKVVVSTDDAAKDFQALAEYTGYCCYDQIKMAGEWRFDETKEQFVMVQ